jgi:rRNA-processing protein FCF1
MEKIVFDTNFILTCIKQKIDFLHELEGFELVLPRQVMKELENIVQDYRKKANERELAKTSLVFIDKFKDKFTIIELKKKYVDLGLEKLEKGYILATLDRELKRKLKGKVKFLIISKRKKLEFSN